jgi:hypothetical protein
MRTTHSVLLVLACTVCGFVGGALGSAVSPTLAAQPGGQGVPSVLRAQRYELVASDGSVTAVIGSLEGGAITRPVYGIALYNSKSERQLSLGIGREGEPMLLLNEPRPGDQSPLDWRNHAYGDALTRLTPDGLMIRAVPTKERKAASGEILLPPRPEADVILTGRSLFLREEDPRVESELSARTGLVKK